MRVLILSSFTKSLFWFRLDLMADLIAAGHEVFAMGPDDDQRYMEEFARRGVLYRSFRVSRNGLSPIEDLRTYLDLKREIRAIAPDKVFTYQAKTIVYGAPAARRAGVRDVYPLVAGLGSLFRGSGTKNRAIAWILSIQYRRAFRLCERVFFQNTDDSSLFVSRSLLPEEKIVMLNGSGVDIERFAVAPLPKQPVFLFIGRLIKDKGTLEYLEACRRIKVLHPHVRCILVGPYDSNPSSLRPEQVAPYVEAGDVEYLGEHEDVRPILAECSVFVLPSYHEGTPKSVLEAMAVGRPIITTDAPGCRETVTDGLNGLLVPAGAVDDLVRAMERFVQSPQIAREMGAESRRIAEMKYDVHKVNEVIMRAMGLVAPSG